jgi:hypothetical protein
MSIIDVKSYESAMFLRGTRTSISNDSTAPRH